MESHLKQSKIWSVPRKKDVRHMGAIPRILGSLTLDAIPGIRRNSVDAFCTLAFATAYWILVPAIPKYDRKSD
jgi:hypothetical protein